MYTTLVPFGAMLPTLPGARDQVTALFAVRVSGAPAEVVASAGVTVAPEVDATAVPVPDSERECGDVVVLSVTVRVAVSVPATEGVMDTAMVQLAPTATEDPQLLLVEKSRELAPLRLKPEMEIGPVPEFEKTIACDGAVVLTV